MISAQSILIQALKSSTFRNPRQLQQHRMYIQQKQLRSFWESTPLYQMQQMLTISNYRIVQYISEYINYFLSEKKTLLGSEAYCICAQNNQNHESKIQRNGISQKIQYYVYDCKIFKSSSYQKDENDMLSAFMVVWKHLPDNYKTNQQQMHQQNGQNQEIYEFIDTGVFKNSTMIFKCKASAILKIFLFFKIANLDTIMGDTIMIPEESYYDFLFNWMHCAQNNQMQSMMRHLFKGLMLLLQNSILLKFKQSLSQDQIYQRKYKKPVCIIPKPSFTQSYTMVESGLGDVEWNTLKIKAFKIKYQVKQQTDRFMCFRVKDSQDIIDENQQLQYDQQYLKAEDRVILDALNRIRIEKYNPSRQYQYSYS